eukprot:14759992-Ditylum_brightwellii.AAC.1
MLKWIQQPRKDKTVMKDNQYTIDGEMCHLHTDCKGKGMGSSNPQEAKVTTKAEDALNRTIDGSKLLNYWEEHFTFNPGTSKEIDWKAIGIAREKIPFQKQKWSSKVAAESLPVGCTMQDREMWQIAECLRICGKELETGAHIFECDKDNVIWRQLMGIFCEWRRKLDAATGLIAAI